MKSLKSLVVTSALIGTLSSAAFANTTQYVYVAGAPAYRQDSNSNLAAYVASRGGGLTATTATGTTTSNINSAKANQWLIPNGVSAGVDLEIDASYTGSTAGIEAVSAGLATAPWGQKFISSNTGTIGATITGTTITSLAAPDFTLSDTFQSTTVFNGTKTFYGAAGTGSPFTATYATLTPTALGIEPYKFVASPGAAAAGLTNITTAQAQALYKNGSLPLAFFTGNSADQSKWVFGLSRDGGSGARLVLQAEIGIGTTTAIKGYQPTITGGTIDSSGNTVNGVDSTDTNSQTGVPKYTAGKVPSTGIWAVAGNGGYPSFGTADQSGLLLAITSTPPTGAIFVTYLNVSDGTEAKNAGSEELTYNGVPYSLGAVQQGKYSFWSYENLFPSATIGTNASAVVTWLESNWVSTAPLTGVQVQRTADGGILSGTYY